MNGLQEAHSYEEPAFDVFARMATPAAGGFGMGRIGSLPQPMSRQQLVAHVKQALGLPTLIVAAPNQLSSGSSSGTQSCHSFLSRYLLYGQPPWSVTTDDGA